MDEEHNSERSEKIKLLGSDNKNLNSISTTSEEEIIIIEEDSLKTLKKSKKKKRKKKRNSKKKRNENHLSLTYTSIHGQPPNFPELPEDCVFHIMTFLPHILTKSSFDPKVDFKSYTSKMNQDFSNDPNVKRPLHIRNQQDPIETLSDNDKSSDSNTYSKKSKFTVKPRLQKLKKLREKYNKENRIGRKNMVLRKILLEFGKVEKYNNPLLSCRLVCQTWNRAALRDYFWRQKFERLCNMIVKPYNDKYEFRKSIYHTRKINTLYLVQSHFRNDDTEVREIIGRLNKESEGYGYHRGYFELLKKVSMRKRFWQEWEILKAFTYRIFIKPLFMNEPCVLICFMVICFIIITIILYFMQSWHSNQYYLMDDNKYPTANIISLTWVLIFIPIMFIIAKMWNIIHLCKAKRIVGHWKYFLYPIHNARLKKMLIKNTINVFIVCIIFLFTMLICIVDYIYVLYFTFFNSSNGNDLDYFTLFLPLFLLTFILYPAQPIIMALINGGILKDGFPLRLNRIRMIRTLIHSVVSGCLALFVFLIYQNYGSIYGFEMDGFVPSLAMLKRKTHVLEISYFIPLYVAELLFICEILIARIEDMKMFNATLLSHTKNFESFSNTTNWFIFAWKCTIIIALMISQALHILVIYFNYQFGAHFIGYNVVLFMFTLLWIFNLYNFRNQYKHMIQDTQYNSDYDSEYTMPPIEASEETF